MLFPRLLVPKACGGQDGPMLQSVKTTAPLLPYKGWHQGQEGHRTSQTSVGHPAPRRKRAKFTFSETSTLPSNQLRPMTTCNHSFPSPSFIFTEEKKRCSTRNL